MECTNDFWIINRNVFSRMTAWIYLLSVIDGALTIYWVLSNLAEEANPLMNYLLTQGPVLFML
ncbi:MAG: hypothetical protein JXR76_08810, partial [Deltaproteobacteria bacterium]|nr:hypothetical protein [Deltaproteobacteria bacterium]